MHRLLRVITHRRLTATLFVVFLGFFCVSLVLPQRPLMSPPEYEAFAKDWPGVSWFAESTGLDDVYRSLVVRIVFVVFIVQLLAYLILRARRVLTEAMGPMSAEPLPLHEDIPVDPDPDVVARLGRALARRRYQVTVRPDGLLLARKHRFAPLSGLIFHASFIVILSGAWVLKAREFRGTARLVEGQPFQGKPSEYASFGPEGLTAEEMPPIAFTPTLIEPIFSDAGHSIDVRCSVRVGVRGADGTAEIGVNRPLSANGLDVLLMDYGLAPAISSHHVSSGRQFDGVFSKLTVWSPGLPADSMRIRRPAATVHVRFFPDYAEGPDGPISRSMKLVDPVLELRIVPDVDGLPGATGLVRLGETVRFGDYELRLDELRKWGEFQIIREEGALLVSGFLLMMVGAFFRLFFVRRWVSGQLSHGENGPCLRIGARAEYFPVSFRDEWDAILADLPLTKETKDTPPREG